jgi:hypothetical protein
MRIEVFVDNEERDEAIDVYGKYLSDEQKDQIQGHKGRVKLDLDLRLGHSFIELYK